MTNEEAIRKIGDHHTLGRPTNSVELLKRVTDKEILFYDGDPDEIAEAQKAILKAMDLLPRS